jgi:CubicO group peptidase (beta-lactamase class C family)
MKTTLACLLLLCLPLPLSAADKKGDDALYFPPARGEWETVEPATIGWDAAKLKEALAYAGKQKSSGVVILYRGRILAEQYWKLSPPEKNSNGGRNPYFHMRLGVNDQGQAIEDVASAQKSVAAMLVGIAQQKGLLKLADPVSKHLGKGWSKAPPEAEAKITIRHLVSMSSGLGTRLQYIAPAGTKWFYNTTAYSRSLTCVARASDMDEDQLTKKWLTGPLGMKDSRWAVRPWADENTVVANKFGFATTARDLARFGLLMSANGFWDGKDVLEDKDYIKQATSPSQQLNPSYGYLWWLNGGPFVARGGGQKKPGRLLPAAPKDMYAAQGKLGRRLYVIPSQQLVITRLGDQSGNNFGGEFFRLLRAASGK